MKMVLVVMISLLGSISVASTEQIVNIQVTIDGFEPSHINVEPNKPVVLKITRTTDSTCATDIQIPSLKIKETLPLNKTVSIQLGKLKKGNIDFGCGMDMMIGAVIEVK